MKRDVEIEFSNNYISSKIIGYRNFITLTKTNLYAMREEWVFYLILICIQPLSLMLFFGFFIKNPAESTIRDYIIGNIIYSITIGTFLSLGQQFSYYKYNKSLDYYMTLPISKRALILSYVVKNTVFVLPTVIILLIVGRLYYNINFNINIMFLISIILSSFVLGSIGVLIGIGGKNISIASLITQIISPIFIFLAPVYVPPQQMPKIINAISYIMPTRYCANAIRNSVLSSGNKVLLDIVLLLIIAIVTNFIVVFMDWQKS